MFIPDPAIVPTPAQLTALAGMTGAGGLYDGAVLHLGQNDIPIGNLTTLADVVEANFTGYASHEITDWGVPFINEQGLAVSVSESHQFQCTDPTTAQNSVYYWYLTNTAGTVYLGGRRLPSPVPFLSPTNALVMEAVVGFPGAVS